MIATQWDDELARLVKKAPGSAARFILQEMVDAFRMGYRQAKAEDAPLLEAAKEAWDCLHELLPGGDVEDFIVEQTGNSDWRGIFKRIEAAIDQYEGRQP